MALLVDVAPGRGAAFAPQMPDPKPAIRADLLDAQFALSKDGTLLWSYETGETAFASPTIDGARLYFATMAGSVFAFSIARAFEPGI